MTRERVDSLMRALIVADRPLQTANIQAVLVRNGFACGATDVTSLAAGAEAAGRARRDVIVLVLPRSASDGLDALRDMRSTTRSPMLVIGPADDPKFILHVLREGAAEYLDQSDLEGELEAAIVRMKVNKLPQGTGGAVIGILSPSGGSGASTLAANVAVALAKRHGRTALVDLKLAAGDQSLLLDLKPTHSLADLCQNCQRMDQSMFQQALASHESGVHLLAAPKRAEEIDLVSSSGVRQVLSMARTLFPYIVLDLDRTFAPEQLAAIVQLDLVMLVSRLDLISLQNTSRVLNTLAQLGVPEQRQMVVANRYGQPKEIGHRRAEQALGRPIAHFIPNDPARVNLANNNGVPVVWARPRSRVARSLVKLAHSLEPRVTGHLGNGSAPVACTPPAAVSSIEHSSGVAAIHN